MNNESLSTHTIEIEDSGVKKTFTIRKMTAWTQFTYTNKIISMIAATDKINPIVVADLIHSVIKSGVSSGKTNDTALRKVLENGGITLAFDVIMNIFANLDEAKQIELLVPLINCITFLNPNPIALDFVANSDKNINLYVYDFVSLYKLAYAVLEFNYKRFFPKADESAIVNS